MTVNHWVAGSSPAGGAKSFTIFGHGVPNLGALLPSLAGVAGLSVLITRMLMPMSHLMGLLERHSDSKGHMGIVPLTSRITIYLSVVTSSVAVLDLPETYIGIALICGVVTFIGALNDRISMHAVYRFSSSVDCLAGHHQHRGESHQSR